VTLRDRDKKLIAAIVPVILIVAYWMLFLSPKRDEASKAGKDLSAAKQKRGEAVARAGQLTQARASYAADYETVVRLGKAIPATVDMPSLLLQLDRAARGTGIYFTSIKAGERKSASTDSSSGGSSTPASGGSPSGGGASSGADASSASSSAPPAVAGGEKAQSGPGKAAESAGNATNTANSASSAAAGANADTNTQTSQTTGHGKGLPVGGGDTSGASTDAAQGSDVPGLDTLPLDFEFKGDFFELADFFHRMKRFVRVVNDRIQVRGRLMTLDTISFTSGDEFPSLTAQFRATVYLTPKAEGVTAGATPEGPAGATPASGGSSTPAPATPPASQSASSAPPSATAVPR
jgi:Tfp pilus assembly protein PilO